MLQDCGVLEILRTMLYIVKSACVSAPNALPPSVHGVRPSVRAVLTFLPVTQATGVING